MAGKWKFVDDFYDGLALVKNIKGKYGFIDKTGKLVIPCRWNFVHFFPFSDGLAAVADEQKNWGYIDKTGKLMIPCQWKSTNFFSNGLAAVMDEQKMGLY